jgi:YHYH protein
MFSRSPWRRFAFPLSALLASACGDGGNSIDAGQGDDAPSGDARNVTSDFCGLSYNALNSSPKVQKASIYSWVCSATTRTLTGNGIPDHAVSGGTFVTPISTQTISQTLPLLPTTTGVVTAVAMDVGFAMNSVKFDPATAGSCSSTATSTGMNGGCVLAMGRDPWRIEAIGGAFIFGVDEHNAHVQPNGQYHYHGMPEGILVGRNKGQAMTLVGYAKDGFPIYARYGLLDATNLQSASKVMTSSWQKKATPDAGRPMVSVFPMGTFTQDYEYVAGSGDLDECNGRTGVTPEFPAGIYHYFITDSFPYIQRCVKGQL